MIVDNQILAMFEEYFALTACPAGFPCDYVAFTKDRRRDMFYAIFKNTKPSLEETKLIFNQVLSFIRNDQMDMKPIVIFMVEDEIINFGILIYWDDKKAYLNTRINWQVWNTDNEQWLSVQIHARRYQLDYLPINYLRVIKTINLNDRSIVDGQVVYLRNFSEQYKMQTPSIMSDTERFNRLITGTPESEYPSDQLDDIIYDRVREFYPMATKETKLLLFHTDLLNLRRYKDFSVKNVSLYFARQQQERQRVVNIECYYYLNIFKRQTPSLGELDARGILSDEEYLRLEQKINNFEPLSKMNI